jgi:hypothetical protein
VDSWQRLAIAADQHKRFHPVVVSTPLSSGPANTEPLSDSLLSFFTKRVCNKCWEKIQGILALQLILQRWILFADIGDFFTYFMHDLLTQFKGDHTVGKCPRMGIIDPTHGWD